MLKRTSQTVVFVADKLGEHTFSCTSFCSVPEAAIENHFNMVGKLVVNDVSLGNYTRGATINNNSTGNTNTTNCPQIGRQSAMQGSTTIICNTTISNTNGTATTLLANASGTNATGAH